jgi:hypothetical protein
MKLFERNHETLELSEDAEVRGNHCAITVTKPIKLKLSGSYNKVSATGDGRISELEDNGRGNQVTGNPNTSYSSGSNNKLSQKGSGNIAIQGTSGSDITIGGKKY